jgi:hypothetical protein
VSDSPSQRYLRNRSAWRVLAPVVAFVAVLAAAIVARVGMGRPQPGQMGGGELVFAGGVGIIAIWAVLDGLRRALGRSTFLGTGRGLDRLFGVIQLVMSIGLAVAMLPNTVRLLDFAASTALGL